jgi:NADP-reducing hydrogenase subunit HndB
MKSLAQLQEIKEKNRAKIDDENTTRVVVGMATCGIAAGARPVLESFLSVVEANKLPNISICQTGCIGLCQFEPLVEITKPGEEKITYINMDAEKARIVADKHLRHGIVVDKYTVTSSALK